MVLLLVSFSQSISWYFLFPGNIVTDSVEFNLAHVVDDNFISADLNTIKMLIAIIIIRKRKLNFAFKSEKKNKKKHLELKT